MADSSAGKVSKKAKYAQTRIGWMDIKPLKGHDVGIREGQDTALWRVTYIYVTVAVVFLVLIVAVVNLQVVHGREYRSLSKENRLEEHVIQPDRGVVYDRFGEKIAINVPTFDLMLNPREIEEEDLDGVFEKLGDIVDKSSDELREKYEKAMEIEPLSRRVLLVQDITRDQVLEIRANSDDLNGVWVDYSSKRKYTGGDSFAHILGYTAEASENEIENSDEVSVGDIVGREGIENYYDDRLRGEKGKRIIEIDAAQNVTAEHVNIGSEPIPGDSLYLTIDSKSQKKLSEILLKGVKTYDATGASAILEDVNTGEIWAAVSVPAYDNNKFIGGISEKDYKKLNEDERLPLFNRIISEQQPPGSMFKTIVASAALQEGAITRDTVFVSTGVMYLGGNTPFQEYHQHAYGPLNLIGGIAKSSNIYFCNTMLELGIEKFVPYAEFFGIGEETGVDIPGEMAGRLPSPENKIALAETSPWLDPIWYPEGDACNTAIGQGITLVTPIQVANWAATIANGGTVMQPRFAYKWESPNSVEDNSGDDEKVESVEVRSGKVSDSNLALVREGMRNSASGPLSVIVPLRNTVVPVAGKTGTAEFGVKDERGYYTSTHAWVMGFFPYDNPRFSFVVFLEGGGESNNSAALAAEFVNWFAEERL
ncbi:penicillin-binding protein 2 [Candidatus Dojkabacteria bacterium]|nr:penicillin-binding protein 2 [Candidatus Dojkabacteria bacterium]